MSASAAILASPAMAQADPDESGGQETTSVGDEQAVTGEQSLLVEPGSSNGAASAVDDAPPTSLGANGEIRESTTFDKGSSPTVVISSSGGAHTSGEEQPKLRTRQVAEQIPAASAAPATAEPAAPVARQLAAVNADHDHGGGGPAPAPAEPAPPMAAPGPVHDMIRDMAPVVKPMVPTALYPLLSIYADFIAPQPSSHEHDVADEAPAPADQYDRVMTIWQETIANDAHHAQMMRDCKDNPNSTMCKEMAAGGGHSGHGSHGTGGSMGPMSMMSMAGMEGMTHPECKGGLFLMCHPALGIEATYNDHDVMFVNHMIPHHGQAVLMSRIVLEKPDLDPRVAALAEQIKAAQGPEIRMMQAWLDTWGNPPSGMVGDHGILPGEDITALRKASGPEASVLFLQQMTYHHNGAVDASVGHLMGGQFDPSLRLASNIISAQRTEIATMSDLLASLGAPATGANVPVAPAAGSSPQPASGGSSGSGGGHHH